MGVAYEHWVLPRRRDFRPSNDALAALVEALQREGWVASPVLPTFDRLKDAIGTPREIAPEANTGGYASRFGANPNFDPAKDRSQIRRSRPLREAIPVPLTSQWIAERIDITHASPLAREIGLTFPLSVPDDFGSEEWDDEEAPIDDRPIWTQASLLYPFAHGEDDSSNYHQIEILLTDDFVRHWSNGFEEIDTTCACGVDLGYEPHDAIEHVAAVDDSRIRRICPSCGATFDPRKRFAKVINGWDSTTTDLEGGITFRFGVRIDCHKGWPREVAPIVLRPEFRRAVEEAIGEPCEDAGALY